MSPVKVLIVDDSVLARRIISSALQIEDFVEVVGSAVDGRNGLKKIKQLNPDIVIMDLEMPEMDGIEALKKIKEEYPHIAVIMFSSISQNTMDKTIQALQLGAEDFIGKPSGSQDIEEAKMLINSSLVPKIKALHGKKKKSGVPVDQPLSKETSQAVPDPGNKTVRGSTPVLASKRPTADPKLSGETPAAKLSGETPAAKLLGETPAAKLLGETSAAKPIVRHKRYPVDIVAIGVSTGGPNALSRLMPSIPASIPVPIVIVQHMPATFTRTLAKRLDAVSKINVKEGIDGEVIKPGTAWIAPGGYHMVVQQASAGVELQLNMDPPEQGCRPAVDVMFRSVARVYGKNTLAIILTGMGKDGLEGSEAVINEGGALYAQDEESSVVWGMPGAVTRAGLPEKVLPLDRIGYEIMLRIETTMIHSNR